MLVHRARIGVRGRATQVHGHVIPGGQTSTSGVAGFTLAVGTAQLSPTLLKEHFDRLFSAEEFDAFRVSSEWERVGDQRG